MPPRGSTAAKTRTRPCWARARTPRRRARGPSPWPARRKPSATSMRRQGPRADPSTPPPTPQRATRRGAALPPPSCGEPSPSERRAPRRRRPLVRADACAKALRCACAQACGFLGGYLEGARTPRAHTTTTTSSFAVCLSLRSHLTSFPSFPPFFEVAQRAFLFV